MLWQNRSMLLRLLVSILLCLLPEGVACAQVAPAARPSSAMVDGMALQLARSASAGILAAFERTQASLDALVRQPVPLQASMTLKVFRTGTPLTIRSLYGPGAPTVDRATMATLHRVGHVIHYEPTPQPHFLVAADTKIGWHRALGVEIPVRELASALGTVPLPKGAELAILSPQGDVLAGPEHSLSPEDLALAATMAGHAPRTLAATSATLGYAPVADSGVGIVVRTPMTAPATLLIASSSAREPSTRSQPVRPAAERARQPGRRGPWLPLVLGVLTAGALWLLILYLRQRWHDQLHALDTSPKPPIGSPEEVLRLAALASSGLPALRESLGSAARSLDRLYVAGTGAPRQIQEALGLAQDLTEQADGLQQRLQQAEHAAADHAGGRDVSAQITQIALDLALAAAQPNPTEEVLRVASQLREVAGTLAGSESVLGDRSPGIAYLLELASGLKSRCELLEGTLASAYQGECVSTQLQIAREALERGVAQLNMLSDRLRSLDRSLSLSEDSP